MDLSFRLDVIIAFIDLAACLLESMFLAELVDGLPPLSSLAPWMELSIYKIILVAMVMLRCCFFFLILGSRFLLRCSV